MSLLTQKVVCGFLVATYVIFRGYVNLINNSGTLGGAIFSSYSILSFTENVTFESNSAESGGAFYMLYGSTLFSNNTLFTYNSASRNGGVFFGVNSNITVRDTVNILFNSAQNGGAMYLESGTFFTISDPIEFINISQNSAMKYGGAIYHQDTVVTSVQYNFDNNSYFEQLPSCFLQLTDTTSIKFSSKVTTISLIEMETFCMEDYWIDVRRYLPTQMIRLLTTLLKTPQFKWCTITILQHQVNPIRCTSVIRMVSMTSSIDQYLFARNQNFTVSIIALAQGGKWVATEVTAISKSINWVKQSNTP